MFKFFKDNSLFYAQKCFIKSNEGEWTYNEVYKKACALSAHLFAAGVKKGDRVILFCGNSVQYVEGFFGILGLRAIAVPVNPVKLAENIRYIVKKCTSSLVLYCNATADKADKIFGILDIKKLNIDEIIDSEEIMDAACTKEPWDFDSGNPDDDALLLFTSGTTSQPKGVTLSHGNLLANTFAINDYLNLDSSDSILMTLPFSYSYGNSILLTHAFVGATIIIENSSAYPSLVLEGIKKHRVTGFSTVGSYIHLMINYIKGLPTPVNYFESLKYITFAGESTDYDDIAYLTEQYPELKVYVMYGQTEASARLSYLCPDLLSVKKGSVGKGLNNVELKVVNNEGDLVRPGEVGEILARGPSIMKGYWDDPIATEQVLKDGWLHTGDSATIDEDGYIYIRGRMTDMIKFMGHRISPLEVENVINSSPFVKESAVVEGRKNGIPCIKAVLILEEGKCLTDAVKQSINLALPNYMRPQIYEIAKSLPRTDNGKIKRSELRNICAQ
ncbi:MAG: acyl--CoA ligase [Clostridiaceae bacterium]|nr:acyl--CoA ligase [Clostridiaceae bacterium]